MLSKISNSNARRSRQLPFVEERPWGKFEQFNENARCTVKLINVRARCRLSLQYHNHRSEFWQVIRGPVIVQIGERTFKAKEGETFEIPPGTIHRLSALGRDSTVLEISYGRFDEHDIIRVQDDFGRGCQSRNF